MRIEGAHVEAGVGRETLERLERVTLAMVGGTTRDHLARRFAEAHAAVSSLASSKPSDPEHFELLDKSESAVRAVAAYMARVAETHAELRQGSHVQSVKSLADDLALARRAAVERAVVPNQTQVEAEAPEDPRHVASLGVPRVRRLPLGAVANVAARPAPTPSLRLPTDPAAGLRQRLFAQARRAIRQGVPITAQPVDEMRAATSAQNTQRSVLALRTPKSNDPDARGSAGERAHLARIARDCMEELGLLGNNRFVARHEMWTPDVPRSEERMLASLDALVALGRSGRVTVDVVDLLITWAADGPAVDVFRPFTRAFVLGCLEGEAAARAALRTMFASHQRTWGAQARALSLARSVHLDDTLAETVAQAPPGLMPHLLRAMWCRRVVPHVRVTPLLRHTDDRVRREAIRACSCVDPQVAVAAMQEQLGREPEDDLLMEAIATLCVIAPSVARREIRERAEAELSRSAVLTVNARRRLTTMLGIVGERSDIDLLLRLLAAHPGDAATVGWHGHPQLIAPLLGLLDHEERDIASAAAFSLHRLSGAELPEPDPRDETPYRPIADRASWDRWFDAHPPAEGEERLRLGTPFTLVQDIDELMALFVPMHVRETAAFELAAHRQAYLPDVRDWLAVQRSALEDVRQHERVEPGKWLDARRKREGQS